jgi:hypothetical protein
VFAILSGFWKKAELLSYWLVTVVGELPVTCKQGYDMGIHFAHIQNECSPLSLLAKHLLRKTLKRLAIEVLWQFTGNARRNLKTVIDS